MRLASRIGVLAFAWTLSVAHAQQDAPASGAVVGAAPGQAPVAAPAEALQEDTFAGAFDIRPTGPRDVRALQSARRNIQALDRMVRLAFDAFYDARPRGAAVDIVDGEIVFTANGRVIAFTSEQQRLVDAFRAATTVRKNAVLDVAMSALTEEDLNALNAAEAALAQADAGSGGRPSAPRGAAGIQGAQHDGEDAAHRNYRDLMERLRAKVRVRAFAERQPMRVVRDPSVIGVERVIIGPEEGSFWTAPAARVLFSQPLVFNRTSRLTEDMVVDRMVGPLFRRKSITVPAGARMFVTATPDGLDAHCLLPRNPLVMRAFAALDMSDQLPCYIDTDFDGRLDSQRNGTEATTTGIHSLRFDFSPIGAVLSPARFEETPPESGAAGYRFGVEAVENNLSPGLQEIVLGMWAAASDSWPRGTARGRARVLIREGETATAEIAGAKIEFRYTGDRTIAFKILECLPERPIVMRAS